MVTTIHKCCCGDPVCKQYTLSTQGSVGFDKETATLYAAADDMLETLKLVQDCPSLDTATLLLIDAAITKAEGAIK